MYVNSGQVTDLLNGVQTDKLKNLKENKELHKACADFEGVLLNYMFQAMKKTVGDGGLFGDSFRKDMYESLFFQEISQKVAETRGVGIGESLYRQLNAKMGDSENDEQVVKDSVG
jgi:flagellar protein FlgJ